MAAETKTTAQEADMDLDFESYTDQDWQRDIRQAGRQLANKYIIKFPNLFIRTITGTQYLLPLDLTPRQLDEQSKDLDKSPLDQIIAMLQKANPGKKQQIDNEMSSSLLAIGDKYGQVIEEVHMASMGKYEPSAPASNGSVPASAPTSHDADGASQQTSAGD
ncbi:hypothetical protein BACT_1067 [Bifidobacterium actinocoloniiforme DSM 22766]|uniref:Uncharacterized protein n=1 Tax=Bifidobacterium actinocoloniiforme DSM 22766 TaxID=1437605 RepID=A0A086Z1G5_9BIFI|nr:hypothetical protein [Bifidobacterium actinocoloniiforme]AKV55509.1 hypothetical protein AB656_03960 [Bifidobacterium actinocoloniiforme DSM 22766]KFI40365.1 hypothetical protein BACT_1067 [Bifidobacterium actinocoloniiforme DSM 22766]